MVHQRNDVAMTSTATRGAGMREVTIGSPAQAWWWINHSRFGSAFSLNGYVAFFKGAA